MTSDPVVEADSGELGRWAPFANREDWLADQHAKYHDLPGNMLGREVCAEVRCDFWDAAVWVLDAERSIITATYADGEGLGCPDCAAVEPHACPFVMADRMPEPRRSKILAHLRAVLDVAPSSPVESGVVTGPVEAPRDLVTGPHGECECVIAADAVDPLRVGPGEGQDEIVKVAARAVERAVGGQLAHDPHDPERYYRFAAEDVLRDVEPLIAARVRAEAVADERQRIETWLAGRVEQADELATAAKSETEQNRHEAIGNALYRALRFVRAGAAGSVPAASACPHGERQTHWAEEPNRQAPSGYVRFWCSSVPAATPPAEPGRQLRVMEAHKLEDCADPASCWYEPHRSGQRLPAEKTEADRGRG